MPDKLTDSEIVKAIEFCLADKVVHCEDCPFYTQCFFNDESLFKPALDLINRLQAENKDLFYKLEGVMHSVDKWLDGDELKQDEVNRAITMREKTLKIVEDLQAENERLRNAYQQCAYEREVFLGEHEEIKAEAYKEFADRLKEKAKKTEIVCSGALITMGYSISHKELEILLKEMVGDT